MQKIIDLYLDVPNTAEDYVKSLSLYCLGAGKSTYAGYRSVYGEPTAAEIGLTLAELDAEAERGGEQAFVKMIVDAAAKHVMPLNKFVEHMDELGVAWGATAARDHDNDKTAALVAQFPNRFKGFCYVDPKKPMQAVRELERCVKELKLSALYLTAFRTLLPANDKKCYPLYAKAQELGVPVFIYSSMNLSAEVPHDIGHPKYIDEVARDFPDLKIMASVGGWPWTTEFIGLSLRHKNLYINMEIIQPKDLSALGRGLEPYLFWMEREAVQNKVCFASNWGPQGVSLADIIAQVDKLPVSDIAKQKMLYDNSIAFWGDMK